MGVLGAIWGLSGAALLLLFAIYRLGAEVYVASGYEWSLLQWGLLLANLLFMAYSEGYKGFQLSFSPRVAARARSLLFNPHPLRVFLAPLFCMGFFHATKRRLWTSYLVTSAIISAVLVFKTIPQPWRGLLDAGVALGLVWGLVSLLIFGCKALFNSDYSHATDLPAPVLRCSS